MGGGAFFLRDAKEGLVERVTCRDLKEVRTSSSPEEPRKDFMDEVILHLSLEGWVRVCLTVHR